MTVTKRHLPKFLRFSGRLSVSQQLMRIGLVITLIFLLIAVLAPAFQAWGWLQNHPVPD